MKRRRPVDRVTRLEIYARDGGRCQSPLSPPVCEGKPTIDFHLMQIDHILTGQYRNDGDANLRVLCPVCHALRAGHEHYSLRVGMIRAGLLPENWEELLWYG